MRLDQAMPANTGAPPLPGGERVGVRGDGPSIVLSPLTRFAAQIDLSPQGRGWNRTRRPTDSTKSHPAPGGRLFAPHRTVGTFGIGGRYSRLSYFFRLGNGRLP